MSGDEFDPTNANVPTIGTTHYELGPIAFDIDRTPQEVLKMNHELMVQKMTLMVERGTAPIDELEKVREDPFYGNATAVALITVISDEFKKRDQTIADLEKRIEVLEHRTQS